jgi:toxin-antitoxin system PIN domain toxin
MFVIDTNVLVHAADRDSEFHQRCLALVERSRRGSAAWYLTWAICYEFLRVITHPRVLRKPWNARSAWSFLEALFASRSLSILQETERHGAVAAEVIGGLPHLAGNLVHDAHKAILMREHGIQTL